MVFTTKFGPQSMICVWILRKNQTSYKEVSMTRNQNDFLRNQEQARSNRVNENLTLLANEEVKRHNLATEGVSRDTLTEQSRHNQATESQASDSLKETTRHNTSVESETNRANLANEYLTGQKNQIQYEYNLANLGEMSRHNQAAEQIGFLQAAASQTSADASRQQADASTRQARVAELRQAVEATAADYNNALTAAKTEAERTAIEQAIAQINRWREQTKLDEFARLTDRYNTFISAFNSVANLITGRQRNFNTLVGSVSRILGGLS